MIEEAAIFKSSECQASVSLSSYESKYYLLIEAWKKAVSLRLLLQELSYISATQIVIWANNHGAIALAESPEFHKRFKYIDMKLH